MVRIIKILLKKLEKPNNVLMWYNNNDYLNNQNISDMIKMLNKIIGQALIKEYYY